MIDEIHKAVVERLKESGYKVAPAEVVDGFSKPCCFVEIDYSKVEEFNKFYDNVELVGSIQFIPKIETKYELIKFQKNIRKIFLRNPLKTSDGLICIHGFSFDIIFPSVVANFTIEITEKIIEDEEFEKIENLQIGGI